MTFGEKKVLIKRKLRKIISKLFVIINYKLYNNRKNIIINIYSMGKVGSSTVMETLFKYYPLNKIFHLHFLSDEWLENKLINTPGYDYNLKIAKEYFNYILNNKNKRLKIISLVRDPIARDISEFFQNHQKYGIDISNKSPEQIVDIIRKRGHNLSINWFKSEFNKYLNIDIYDFVFDKEKGYSIYTFNAFDLLIIQLEKLNDIYRKAFKEFLGIEVEKLNNSNKTIDKFNKNLLKSIKEEYSEDKDVLNIIYNSQYCKHFYSEKQIKSMKTKWAKE